MKQYKTKISVKYEGTEIFKQLTYDELVNRIKARSYIMNKFNVIEYLIGYNGVVTEDDYNNIQKAYQDNIIN